MTRTLEPEDAVGFYDCRCLVTGVSLKGADAAAVLLQKAKAYRPIALAMKGNYDRLGTIDMIDTDANTRLVQNYFLAKLQSGEFVVDEDYCRVRDRYPIKDVEQLLWCFERNTNDNPKTALLNGEPVVTALVCRAVWGAIARDAAAGGTATELFAELFDGVPVAEEIYRGKLSEVARHLRELAAVSHFLKRRKTAWTPTESDGQHYTEETREYLAAARKTFRGSAVVLAGLKDYEREIADLLEEEEEEDD